MLQWSLTSTHLKFNDVLNITIFSITNEPNQTNKMRCFHYYYYYYYYYYYLQPLESITKRAEKLSIEVVSSINDGKTSEAASIAKTADIAFVFAKAYVAEMNDLSHLKVDNDVDKLVCVYIQ